MTVVFKSELATVVVQAFRNMCVELSQRIVSITSTDSATAKAGNEAEAFASGNLVVVSGGHRVAHAETFAIYDDVAFIPAGLRVAALGAGTGFFTDCIECGFFGNYPIAITMTFPEAVVACYDFVQVTVSPLLSFSLPPSSAGSLSVMLST